MADADIRIRTTHDGTQAERSMSKLQSSIDRLGSTVGGKVQSALVGLFSVEKVLQFAKAIDAAAQRAGDLVEKIKQGKATVDDLDKTGISRENAALASEYTTFKEKIRPQVENLKLGVLRTALSAIPLTPLGALATVSDFNLATLIRSSVRPRASAITAAQDAGNTERDRQATIEWIRRQEEEAEGVHGGNFSGLSAIPKSNDREVTIAQKQLLELQRISRSLNPSATKLLQRSTMFPD